MKNSFAPLAQQESGGDGRHLAIASQIFGVRIAVVGDRPYWFGTGEATWMIRFDARLEHYDVVVPEKPERKMEAKEGIQDNATKDAERAKNSGDEESKK